MVKTMSEAMAEYGPGLAVEPAGLTGLLDSPAVEPEAPAAGMDEWGDIDDEWRAELPSVRPSPGLKSYADGISPDDWEIAERVARRYARNEHDRALASHSLDEEIEEAQRVCNELFVLRASIDATYQRREQYLREYYGPFLQAFTAAATEGHKGRFVDVGKVRYSLANNPPSVKIVPERENDVLAWCRVHLPAAIKETLLTTPIKAILSTYKVVTKPSSAIVNTATGETMDPANYPPHCSLEQTQRFGIKVR